MYVQYTRRRIYTLRDITHGGYINTKGHTHEGDIHTKGHTHAEGHARGGDVHMERAYMCRGIHTEGHKRGGFGFFLIGISSTFLKFFMIIN